MPQKNVLVVVATKEEIQPMLDSLAITTVLEGLPVEIAFEGINLTILVTGIDGIIQPMLWVVCPIHPLHIA